MVVRKTADKRYLLIELIGARLNLKTADKRSLKKKRSFLRPRARFREQGPRAFKIGSTRSFRSCQTCHGRWNRRGCGAAQPPVLFGHPVDFPDLCTSVSKTALHNREPGTRGRRARGRFVAPVRVPIHREPHSFTAHKGQLTQVTRPHTQIDFLSFSQFGTQLMRRPLAPGPPAPARAPAMSQMLRLWMYVRTCMCGTRAR